MNLKKIFESIENSEKELIDLTCELIRKKTVNLPGDEYLAAEVVIDFFKANSIEFEKFEKESGRTNVIGYINKGKKPSVFLAGHLDVVPAGDLSSWATPPFDPVIKDGKIFGRGSSDNKGQTAALLMLSKELKKIENDLNCEVLIGAVADEELGSKLGVGYLMEAEKISPDYAIIPDIGGSNCAIDIAEKGLINIRVISHGKKAHSSLPHLGLNAIDKLAEFIKKLEPIVLTHEPNRYFDAPTKSVNIIHGGAAHNIVPDKAEALVNIRYLPSMTPETIIKDFEEVGKKVMNGEFEFIGMDQLNPTEVSPDNVVVEAIIKNAKEHCGLDVKLIGLGGATVCKQLIEKGVIAIGYGPGDSTIAHMSDEFIEIKELIQFQKVMVSTLLEFGKDV
ncbi:ArgE/DapE family deacylase [Candidatus Dependentiae bacterium]|nr:ArgE/DapE family deacylase [Candidatus Dependentiae bacterium]